MCRVVVTGAGVVSSLGTSLTEFWERLSAGESGVGPVVRFDSSRFSCRLAAQVDSKGCGIVGGSYSQEIKRAGKFVQYAVVAAEQALGDARICMEREDPGDSALFLGVSTGGLDEVESAVLRQEAKGPRKVSPYQITAMLPNMAASLIALRHRYRGAQYTISGACASGAQALGQAFCAIRSGQISWSIAGGCDAILTPIAFSSFEAMRMLSKNADCHATPRPFDAHSDGMIIGEGAAIFILEEADRAHRRGARAYAELSGYGTCSGGDRIALQSVSDLVHSMRLTIADARLRPSNIDCIYAQAAGVRQGDQIELAACQSLFGNERERPVIVSIKGHVGHTFAASGPLNVVAALGALAGRRVPPTLNFRSVAPEYANLTLESRARTDIRHCLINTYGFGGINAGLVVSRGPAVDPAKDRRPRSDLRVESRAEGS
jgi:3-oxoacyl-[acyl-carrier-protein] synthase II